MILCEYKWFKVVFTLFIVESYFGSVFMARHVERFA